MRLLNSYYKATKYITQNLLSRNRKLGVIMFFLLISLAISVNAQVVSTFAGSGTAGSANGTDTSAQFSQPNGVATDKYGNVYVADRTNHKIRKITPSGVVSTFAGNGSSGSTNGVGTSASFSYPYGVTVDKNGNVYVADLGNNKIRKITSSGVVSTLAGSGSAGAVDGVGINASFDNPHGVAVDNNGNVYVADINNNKIRKITASGVVSTLAGSGSAGAVDGIGVNSSFYGPRGVAVDKNGNVYVADFRNHNVRKITSNGVVSTFAGSGSSGSTNDTGVAASFNGPNGILVDNNGNLFVADYFNHKIRKITPSGNVSTLAGSGYQGSTNGVLTSASFRYPTGVALDSSGNIFIADYWNHKIRKITGCANDNEKPTVITKNSVIYLTDKGQGTLTVSQIDNGSTDNCYLFNHQLSKTNFECSNIGTNLVYLIVTDKNGNIDSSSSIVTVKDTIKPKALTKNISVPLFSDNQVNISNSQINNGSSDNCSILSYSLSKSFFDCKDIGTNLVYLKVTDASGNIDSAEAKITVIDFQKPKALIKNLIVFLNSNGQASISVNQINNGSSDNCGIVSISLSKSSFNCSNIGKNTVYLRITDLSGNIDSASSEVTVLDITAPTLLSAPKDVILGSCNARYSYSLPTASDNCSYSLTQIAGLASGSEFPVGITKNTFRIVDPSGNEVLTSFNVEVKEVEPPNYIEDMVLCDNKSLIDLSKGIDNLTFTGKGILSDKITFSTSNSGIGMHNIASKYVDSYGCEFSNSFKIEVAEAPITPKIIRLSSYQIATEIEYKTYKWHRNGIEIDGEHSQILKVDELGLYSVEVSNNTDCYASSESYSFGIDKQHDNVLKKENTLVYPNPTTGVFYVEFLDEDTKHSVLITNSLGEQLLRLESESKVVKINIGDFANGTYVLSISSSTSNQNFSIIKK